LSHPVFSPGTTLPFIHIYDKFVPRRLVAGLEKFTLADRQRVFALTMSKERPHTASAAQAGFCPERLAFKADDNLAVRG
jgi:hypothetical protein